MKKALRVAAVSVFALFFGHAALDWYLGLVG